MKKLETRFDSMINNLIEKYIRKKSFYKDQLKEIKKYGIKSEYNPKLTQTYAQVYLNTDYKVDGFIIYFGDILFTTKVSIKTRKDVVAHEIAHIIDYLIRSVSFHDETWKQIHKSLGGSGKTTISLDN